MVKMRADSSGIRLSVLGITVLALMVTLFGRLWYLQVVASPGLEQSVEGKKLQRVPLPAIRGRIYDSQGRILADNRRSLTVTIDRDQIRDTKKRALLFERLAGPLGVLPADLEARFAEVRWSPLLPFPAADDVSEQTAIWLKERREDYPGLDVQEGFQRFYRFAPLASHIIGYVGAVPAKQAKSYRDRGYQLSDTVGIAGIEQAFESELRGSPGYRIVEVNALNRPVRVVEEVPPKPGNDIQLTIDLKVQQYAEQILDAELRTRRQQSPPDQKDPAGRVIRTPGSFRAPAGSVVMLDVNTGAIAAMASNPPFDNRWFTTGGVPDARFKQLFGGKYSPLINRVVQGEYLIGSTMKPFTAASALHWNLLDPNAKFDDQGKYVIPECKDQDEVAGCIRYNAGKAKYGLLNLTEALTVSSDVYFYGLGYRLWTETPVGSDALQNDLRAFGFGKLSGIDLPEEHSGRVPDRAAKKKLADAGAINQQAGTNYFSGDNMQLAIGQGLVAVTPLQLADAYATFANGGIHWRPMIVQAIYAPDAPDKSSGVVDLSKATVVRQIAPQQLNTVDFLPSVREPIAAGLEGVVSKTVVTKTGPHEGTAEKAFADYTFAKEFPVSGKTGTAQLGDGSKSEEDTSLFGAFGGPKDGPPVYASAAVLEQAGFGGQSAAPMTKCLFEKLADPSSLAEPLQQPSLDKTQTVAARLPALDPADSLCLVFQDQTKD